MDYANSNPSSSLSEESSQAVVSAIQYIALDEITSGDSDRPDKERFVRLMSLDSNELSQCSSSTIFDSYADTCSQYWDIVSLAEKLVNDIIYEAEGIDVLKRNTSILLPLFSFLGLINKHVRQISISKEASKEIIVRKLSGDYPVIEYNRPEFTGWPTIGDFTIELGADKIDEYLASFNSNEEWLYIIYYLGVKNDYPSKYYEYQVSCFKICTFCTK